MKNMQTPSQRFMAVRLDTTGSFERNLKGVSWWSNVVRSVCNFNEFADQIKIVLVFQLTLFVKPFKTHCNRMSIVPKVHLTRSGLFFICPDASGESQ